MGDTSESTGVPHSIQKISLVGARVFPGQLHLDVKCSTIRDSMSPDISLAVVPDVHDGAVLSVELPHRMVSGDAAVLTEGYDDFVL